jgi:hypothetical protein
MALGHDAGVKAADAGPGPDVPPRSCTGNVVSGLPIQELQVAEALPTPTGGVIPGGFLLQRSHTIYTGPGGATGPNGKTRRNTTAFDLSGLPHMNEALSLNDGLSVERSLRVKITGASIELTQTCPGPQPPYTVGYSVTAGVLSIINPATSTVETFTRR